ncbi:MAG: RNA polymerase sigma factor [Deltaproteobacteria bacterium]|nr:RNA polymerase sigma factor [Deltaproteobacteria bacterium]
MRDPSATRLWLPPPSAEVRLGVDGCDAVEPMTSTTATEAVADPAEVLRAIEAIHRDCFGWALACCGRSRSDAEDVLQMVYLEIWRRKARFAGRSSLKTWVFGVIRRIAARYRRGRQLRVLLHLQVAAEPAPVESPAFLAEEAHRRFELLRALGELSVRQRQVLELVFYHDLTVEESAGVLSISVGSARTHYDRGKRRLREALAGVEG